MSQHALYIFFGIILKYTVLPVYNVVIFILKYGTHMRQHIHPNPEKYKSEFANRMTQQIQNLGPKEWRIAHSHVTSTYLNESKPLLTKWRVNIESQGYQLINTIMLRDPLNHAMSLHNKNQTKE